MAAILEVKNLSKKYGDFAAVKGISFEIPAVRIRGGPAGVLRRGAETGTDPDG